MTVEMFKGKIVNADVTIVAITNHNVFDHDQFVELKEAINDSCQLWPGIEIDVEGITNNEYHLIVVADPSNVVVFNEKVQELYAEKDINNALLKIEEVYSTLNSCNVFFLFT